MDDKAINFCEYLNTKEKDCILIEYNGTIYKLGFEYLFDILDDNANLFLNKLFDYSKKFSNDYINKIAWITFLASSQTTIPAYNEKYININENKKGEISILLGGKKINSYINENDFENNKTVYKYENKPLFKVSDTSINKILLDNLTNDSMLVSVKSATYLNLTEFLILFLNFIFSSSKPFCIKKCNLCEKYYVATKTDNRYCKRTRQFNNKNLTCDLCVSTLEKTYEYKSIMNNNKSLLQKFQNNKNISDEYIENYKMKRDKEKMNYFKTANIKNLTIFIKDYEKNNPM